MQITQRILFNGIGDFVLDVISSEYKMFVLAVGNVLVRYLILSENGTQWENGFGTLAVGGAFTRDSVLTNHLSTTAKIDFDQGLHLLQINDIEFASVGASFTDATITLAFSGLHSDVATVTDAAINAGSKVSITWGTVAETDENSPEHDVITFTATPSAGGMSVLVSSSAPVGGAYNIRYLVG